MSSSFYDKIPVIHEFEQLVEGRHFHSVPDNWSVVITDIQGSTAALNAGRYKDVNLVGAAAIVAVLEQLETDIPYVFNGDGAALLIPTEQSARCREVLSGLVWLVKDRFDLNLRAAIYPVHELISSSQGMDIARLHLAESKSLAEFRGGALLRAEDMLKSHPDSCIPADEGKAELCSLNRLTCRWQQMQSKRGAILSLLVLPQRTEDVHLFGRVIAKLSEIAGGSLSDLNPVSTEETGYKSILTCLREEARLHKDIWTRAYFNRLISILIAVPLFRWKLHRFFFWADNYVKKIDQHADYRKLDDTLRLVIDCSDQQIAQIEHYLEQQYRSGTLFYGLHRSEAAQMTCYVDSTADGEHVHFVDGSDGGYAAAAVQLKAQMAQQRAQQLEAATA